MKSLKNLLNENVINERAHIDLNTAAGLPKYNQLAIGIWQDDGQIGLVIGGVFKGGDEAGQKQAEAEVKKFGAKIDESYDDAYEWALHHNDDDLTGATMCYFLPIEDFNKHKGAVAMPIGGPESIQILAY